MDKALKQRLVGASVIIALAVIVLPMLLNGRPEGRSEQSQKMEIPPRPDELSFETRRFPVADAMEESRPGENASASSEASAQALPALPAAKATPDAEKVDSTGTQPGPGEGSVSQAQVGAPVGPESASGPVSPAAGVEQNSAGSGREIAVPGVSKEVLASDVEAGPESEPEAGPATDSPAPATNVAESGVGNRYMVQVTSLSNTDNARRLVSQLQKQGFHVLLDTVESDVGRLNRVRVGPFAKETEAVEVSARIKSEFKGTSPRVLDLNPGLAAPVTNPNDPLVRWVIQLGSFKESTNAQKLVDQLRSDGMTAYLETLTAEAITTYRVLVGPFLEREEAIRTRQQLSEHLKIDGVIMSAD